ncbi:MAG: amidohydrolase family protein [Pirellulales bacterium]|nr:amidohydrolase family protein [Pirellulales bacterium]
MRRRSAVFIFAAALLTAGPSAGRAEDSKPKQPEARYFAVTKATVHTVTGPVIHGPTVLCKDGKIAAIGHDVAIPDDAEVLDAEGFHLYPGLVAVRSSGLVGNEPPEDNTNVYSLSMTLGLAGGVTTAVANDTAAKLSFGTLEDHVVKRNLFAAISYTTRDPNGRRTFRQALEQARRFLRDLQAHEEKKKTDPAAKPPDAASLKGLNQTALKLLRHEVIGVADADTAQELKDLAELAERYDFRLVVRGAREGWVSAAAMARAGLYAVITPRTRRDRDERSNHPNGSSIENARILHEHGVPFAIVPGSTSISTSGLAGRDLWQLAMEAAFAVRGGLPDDAAVRAITIDAARVLGIEHRVGSIEVGKDADFAIVDGDLLHYMTLVRWTVVNGRVAYDKQKDSLLEHIRPGGDRDAPPPPDYWPRRLGEG